MQFKDIAKNIITSYKYKNLQDLLSISHNWKLINELFYNVSYPAYIYRDGQEFYLKIVVQPHYFLYMKSSLKKVEKEVNFLTQCKYKIILRAKYY